MTGAGRDDPEGTVPTQATHGGVGPEEAEATDRIVGVVPCAGASRRMGRPKALLSEGGKTFLEMAVAALLDGGCHDVYVVLDGRRTQDGGPPVDGGLDGNADGNLDGNVDDNVARDRMAALAEAAGARVLYNPDPGEGPITSLRLALSEVEPRPGAVAYLPVDHPGVKAETVRAILDAFRSGGSPLALPVYEGRRGHPAVFGAALFPELLDPALEGGARTVVRAHIEDAALVDVDDPAVVRDIDTPEAYAKAFPEASADDAVSRHGATGTGPSPNPAEAAALLLEASESGGEAGCLTLVAGPGAGRRLLLSRTLRGEEHVRGGLGSDGADREGLALLRRALRDPDHKDGLRQLGTAGEVYLEVRRAVPELVIVGAGHIAQPLCAMGALLGYRVTVVDDRPDFATRERFPEAARVVRVDFGAPFADIALHPGSHVLLVTRGHKYDYDCLVPLLRADPPPRYIGMIGSRRRVRATFLQLLEDGIPRERLDDIHAPVGLDVGAETPAEIAVAVAAELVLLRRGGSGAPLKEVARVAERFFPEEPKT